MNIQVTPHTITITINTNINAGEYNITPCEFTFTEEYEDLTKEAIFSSCDGSVFKVSILNNQCTIPYEVLQQEGNVLLGVYAYETNDDELVLRYSPTPQYFNVKRGSFQVGNDPDLPSPTEWERVLEQINQAIEETNNLNITANKEGKVTTVTITKKDGTTQEVEINDGKDLEFKWQGTSLGVRQEGQSEYDYTDLKGAKGDTGATPNIQIGDVQTGDTSEVTITGTDENPIFNFTLEKGETGNGISSITKTSTSGLVDTYTITFTNGQTTTYEITNGENGSVVDVQVDGTSVVDNGVANIIGLTEMKQELEDMYNLLPKVQGTGETITLDGTVAGKMLVDLKGNTSQETTTGKNKIETTLSGSYANLTVSQNNDKTINISGTPNQNWFNITPIISKTLTNGNYVFSINKTLLFNIGLAFFDSDNTQTKNFYINAGNTSATGTIDSSDVKYRIYVDGMSQSTNYNISSLGCQLESGSSSTSYEPYTGGQASPNPQYPQDIHVVSGDNSIEVCGKNLFDYNNATIKNDYAKDENGTEISSQGSNYTTSYTKVLPNTTYTFSYNLTSVASRIYFYDSNKNWISRTNNIINSSNSYTFTTPNNCYYLQFLNVIKFSTTKPMLNDGSTALPYEAYTSASYPINLGVENLWKPIPSATKNGITLTYNSDGSYTLNGTSTANTSFYTTVNYPTGTYSISANNSQIITGGSDYLLLETSGGTSTNKTLTFSIVNNKATYDITSPITTVVIVISSGKTYNNFVIKPQLEKGSKVNSFSKYGTTPIELCKIGDYQDSIKKSTGKNLFDNSLLNKELAYQATTSISNGVLTITSNSSTGVSFARLLPTLTLSPNTQYACSFDINGAFLQARLYDVDANNYTTIPTSTSGSRVSGTFTTSSNTTYELVLYITLQQSCSFSKIQVEQGSIATEYEPYGKVWYLHKEIGKTNLKDEAIALQSINSYNIANFLVQPIETNVPDISKLENSLCNRFSRQTTGIAQTQTEGFLRTLNASISALGVYIRISSDRANTVETFKSWLENNPTYYYWALYTPTYTEITDSTLISQLETVKRSFNGQTNINQENNDKPFILDVTALKELTQ